jgi:MFS family permease
MASSDGDVRAAFPPVERPRAFALFGVAIGMGAMSGQVVGGLLVARRPA